VDGAKNYETYVGDQKSAAFVWMDERRNLLKLLFLVRGRALEWVRNEKVRSGVLVDSQTGEIEWSEEFDALSHQFFADVLLSWLNVSQGPFFVKSLLENSLTLDDELSRFPLLN
jgi:hypothetical protein